MPSNRQLFHGFPPLITPARIANGYPALDQFFQGFAFAVPTSGGGLGADVVGVGKIARGAGHLVRDSLRGAFRVVRDNLHGETVPSIFDDITQGWSAGSLWYYEIASIPTWYICTKNTKNGAIWRNIALFDHGDLSGRSDDDHSQYLLATGLREWSEQGSTPSTPAEDKWKLYFENDGLRVLEDTGILFKVPFLFDRQHWVEITTDGDTIASLGAAVAHLGGTRTTNHDANGSWLNYNATTSSITGGFDSDSFDILQGRHLPTFYIRMKTGALDNARYFFGFTSASFTGNSDTLPGHGAAFRYSPGAGDTAWKGITRDGTTQAVSSDVAAIAANTEYLLKIRFAASNVIYFSVNGGTEVADGGNTPGASQGLGFMALVRPTSGSEVWGFSKMSIFWGLSPSSP